jgi:molybdopterin converting factor small subunit
MPLVKIPMPMRYYVNNQADVQAKGDYVASVLEDLFVQFPDLRNHICRKDGNLHAHLNIFLGKINIKELQELKTPVHSDDVLHIIPSIAGG